MTEKLTHLTPEQEALKKVVVDDWVGFCLGGDTSINEADAREGIEWIYKRINMPAPAEIKFVDSPLAMVREIRKFQPTRTETDGFGLQYDAGWVANYDYYRRIGVLQSDDFNSLLKFLRAGCWEVSFFTDVALISKRPKRVIKDEQGRLHSPNTPSVEFDDGFSVYTWHGTIVPKEWILDPKSQPVTLALNHPNIEQRRAFCEIITWKEVIKQLNPKVINTDENPMIGTLLEVDLPDAGVSRFLRVLCGTGREFVLPVPNDAPTARHANAWTYGLKPEELNVEVRT